jgi:hypothetical protein
MKRLVLCQFLMAFNVLKKGPRPSGTCRAQSRCGPVPYTESIVSSFAAMYAFPCVRRGQSRLDSVPVACSPPPCPLSPIHLPQCAESTFSGNATVEYSAIPSAWTVRSFYSRSRCAAPLRFGYSMAHT